MREMELAVLDWIQAYMRCGALDVLMPFISRLSDHGEIWILTAAALAESGEDAGLRAGTGPGGLQPAPETPDRPGKTLSPAA